MRIVARYNVQVAGHGIVRRGRTIDMDEAFIDERIAANFVKEDGSSLTAEKRVTGKRPEPTQEDTDEAKIERTAKVIGRDGIMRKLDEMGITYSPKHKTDYLARLYLSAQGEI